MNILTWNQFKTLVDEKLKAQGATGNEEIWYVDASYPNAGTGMDSVEVYVKDNEIVVQT